jgi:hypothetical protein
MSQTPNMLLPKITRLGRRAICTALLAASIALRSAAAEPTHTFAIGAADFLLDGQKL